MTELAKYSMYIKDDVSTEHFNLHQYEDIYGRTCDYDIIVEARYIEQDEHDYIGNPLIEALPPSYSSEQVYSLLEKGIFFSTKEREKNDIRRGHAIVRMKNMMSIWNNHLLLAHKFDLVIKRGYTSHSLHTPQNLKEGRENAKKVVEACKETENLMEFKLNKVQPYMPGFSIIGISGGGKTVAMDHVLSFYPQVIEHRNYKGKRGLFKQLSWMKIDASYDGNIGGICKQFIRNVDKVLQTDYSKKLNKPNIDDLIFSMAYIASIHKLGCLVIDEIQHIQQAKVGPARVLNFLVSLQNMMKLPIILIGTYKALNGVLANEYRQARRASGIGEIEWGLLKNDDEYKDFLTALFRYQWVKNETVLTDEMVQSFYRYTAGNVARTVLIYQLCQLEAINIGMEIINEDIIELVASELPLTNEFIRALREQDYEKLAKMDDLYYSNFDELVTNKYEELQAKDELKKIKLSIEMQEKQKRKELEVELVSFLYDIGETKDNAIKYVNYVLNESEDEIDVRIVKRRLAKIAYGEEKLPQKKKVKKAAVPSVDDFKVDIVIE